MGLDSPQAPPLLRKGRGPGKVCVDFVFVWQHQKSGATNQIAVLGT